MHAYTALPRRLLADLSRLANWSTNRPSSSSASNKYGEGGNSSRYSTSSSLGLEKGLGRGREEGGEMIREGRTTKQRRPVSLSGYSSSSLASTSSSSISVVRHLPSEEEKKKKTSSFGGSVFAV
jgi:hypothetical protein